MRQGFDSYWHKRTYLEAHPEEKARYDARRVGPPPASAPMTSAA